MLIHGVDNPPPPAACILAAGANCVDEPCVIRSVDVGEFDIKQGFKFSWERHEGPPQSRIADRDHFCRTGSIRTGSNPGLGNAVVAALGQGQAFQYDANGNLLSDGTRTYEWDAENRLTAINIGAQRSQFAYDGLGRRVLITELNNGAVASSRHYIWVEDQIVEETDATVDPTGTVTAPGNFDSLNCNQVAGWAWNPAQPNTPVSVSIESGTTSEATVLANTYRSDLKLAGAGNGNHGFTYPLPAHFKTGTAQAVTLLLTGTTTSLGTRTVTCTAPSFAGSFASPSCTQLAGWAWDATEPNDPINVDVYDGTTLIATVLASTFRQDLENAGIGNGAHGFFLPTPAALKTGTAQTITLKAGGTPTVIGAPQTLTCSSANFGGYFDTADCTQLVGWAWDANQPNAALNVDIYDNGALLATIPAANFRQDLQTAGKGNGDHGFTYSTPALYSGTTHSLSITYSGTTIPLGDTPKTITCPTEPILTRFFPGGMQSGGGNYYFSYDHLGSVREVTDTSGNVVSRYDYDPYGRLTINEGTPPRFGFASYYYHSPSGLSLTKFRAYDPSLGRWESRDPKPQTGETGLYQYASGDPVNLFDPLGDSWKPPARGGPPDTWQWIPDPDGGGTWRHFGPDGCADKDIDYGHDHGQGDPHAHDWKWKNWQRGGPSPRVPGALPPSSLPIPTDPSQPQLVPDDSIPSPSSLSNFMNLLATEGVVLQMLYQQELQNLLKLPPFLQWLSDNAQSTSRTGPPGYGWATLVED